MDVTLEDGTAVHVLFALHPTHPYRHNSIVEAIVEAHKIHLTDAQMEAMMLTITVQ